MIKFKLDANDVIRNIDRCLDLTKNFAPVLRVILGEYQDKSGMTMRGGVARSFANKVSPDGQTWASLSPGYQAKKAIKFPGMPTLVASGRLFNSLTRKFEGETDDGVAVLTNTKLTYGTKLPYAKYHMLGTKHMVARPFMGASRKQQESWKILVGRYITATVTGDKTTLDKLTKGG